MAQSKRKQKVDTGYSLPETGTSLLRLPQILAVIPISPTTWWLGVKTGRFPKPVKLSTRCSVWRVEDIRDLVASFGK